MPFTLNPDGSLAPEEAGDAAGAETAGGQPAPAPSALVTDTGAPAAAPADGDLIKESSTAGFMADVVDVSQRVPVIVDFWAPWCGPCKQLTPMLEKLVRESAGMVRLVKINVDENQDLAAQMRIQSIPAVYAFSKGQPVDGFMGALPEGQLRTFIGRLTGGAKTPLETALEQAAEALEAGDTATAGAIFAKVQDQDPANPAAIAGMIRVAVADGDNERARQMADSLPADVAAKPEIQAALSALELSQASEEAGDTAELRARLEKDAGDHQARFDLATALYAQRQNEAAIDELLELFRRDRQWDDEAARKQLVKIFDALGATDPLTQAGRKRLSSLLFS